MWSAMAKALRTRDKSTAPSPLGAGRSIALLIAAAMMLSPPQMLGSPSPIAGKSFATFAMLDLLCHFRASSPIQQQLHQLRISTAAGKSLKTTCADKQTTGGTPPGVR